MGILNMMKSKSPLFKPWRTDGTEMTPNILLMCKLLLFLLIVHGFYQDLEDPFLPFLRFFDQFNVHPGLFKGILRSTFLVAGFFLVMNFKVRLMSFLLGLVIILSIVASKPLFKNHLFVCGCMFFLVGLSHKERYPWLLVVQLSIMYFGAFFNKIFEPDWWSGQFMHNWLYNAIDNTPYNFFSGILPNLLFAKFLSWAAIGTELLLAILLLLKKYHNKVVWIVILFHGSLFIFIADRFGHFFENTLIFMLIFAKWPEEKLQVYYAPNFRMLRILLSLIDFNQCIKWDSLSQKGKVWLKIVMPMEGEMTNINALKKVLVHYCAGFFALLFVIDLGIRVLLNNDPLHFTYVLVFIILVGFFFPFKTFFKSPAKLRT